MGRGFYERFTALSTEDQQALLARIDDDPPARRQVTPSAAQRRMWFLHRAGLDRSDYNSPVALRFLGRIDVDALRAALNALSARHSALATRFVEWRGEPLVLASAQPPPLRFADLRGSGSGHWRRLVDEEARRPFDLAGGPLLRCLVVALADDDFVVVLTAHHSVIDGWSLGVVFRELAALYRGEPLPPPTHQYADFVAWQKERDLGGQLEHWRERLRDAPVVLDVPGDRPRPARSTMRGHVVTAVLPATVSGGLREVGASLGTTSFMAHSALLLATLAHYSGQDEVVIGVPHAGRDRREFASVVGLLVNTVVLRADLADDPSFTELLGRVKRDLLAAHRNAAVPFDQLVDALEVPRSLDRNPVFQAFLTHEPVGEATLELGGVTGEPLTIERTTTALDLDVHVAEAAGGTAEVTLTYAADLFDRATARRVLRHYTRLAAAAAAAPDTPLRDLPFLDPAERAELLCAKHPEAERTVDCLHDFVALSVAANPGAVAVVRGEDRLTYRELDERSNRLAWYLREAGVGPETPVGVRVSREPRLLVAILAVLKAGGAYVPMETTLPAQRLAALVEDAQVAVMVTDSAHRTPSYQGVEVLLDEDAPAIAARPATTPPATAGPANMAYVMYTSGSTGAPKGVVVEHRHAVGLVEYYRSVLSPEEVSGVLASTPVGFDATIQEYFATLLLGGTVILVDSVFDLHTLPQRDSVTLVQGVPSLLAELLGNGPLPGGVTTVMLSGEPLPGELAEQLYASGSVKRVYNIYGVTEYTADSTWCLVDRGTRRPGMGEPLPGVRCYVLDARWRPVPPGAGGELYLAGPGLSRGYLRRYDLTAQQFLPDPFVSGERMYRTGDLVRLRSDDQLDYLGRTDRQVKVAGCRVEPGEVEAALREHPAVALAAVVPHENGLAAYVTAVPGERVPQDLRGFLVRRIPAFMVPGTVTVLDALPLNPNGKLDVRALPAPEHRGSESSGPSTSTQERLLVVWRQVLGRGDVGVRDDFFASGGHSLLALRMAAVLKDEFGAAVPVSALFERPTVADLADLIDAGTPTQTGPALIALKDGVGTPIVLVHAVGGGVLSYVDLVAALPGDRSVFGIEAEGLVSGLPVSSVPELATRYLNLVAQLGRFVLAGWSMGGTVACEMACRAPELVESLVLIDMPLADGRAPTDEATLVALHSEYLAAAAGRASGLAVGAVGPEPLVSLLAWARSEGLLGEETSQAELRRIFDVFTANMRAFDAYPPRPVPVPTLYLDAGNARAAAMRDLLGEHVVVRGVGGGHHSVLQPPHVSALAAEIDGWASRHQRRLVPDSG